MSDLSSEEKLVALGLKAPTSQANPYRDLFQQLRDAVDYATFVEDVGGLADFAAFETYLTDSIGMTADDASRFRTLVEQKYGDITTFQTALSEASSYDVWESEFKFGASLSTTPTEEDPTQAGVRIHSEPGVSFDGVAVPKGTVEVYGPRVEFSETRAYDRTVPDFSYTNLTVSNTLPALYETVDISVDVTNNTATDLSPVIRLIEDGEVVDSKTPRVGAGLTRSITFERSWSDYVSVTVRIEESESATISVAPGGVT